MYICEKDYHCVDCPRIYPEEECDHWVEVEFIVRCRDCTYYDGATVNSKGFLICPASGMEITDEDFCSYGERRDES